MNRENEPLQTSDAPKPSDPMPLLPAKEYFRRASVTLAPVVISIVGHWLINKGVISDETLQEWTGMHKDAVANAIFVGINTAWLYIREHQADSAIIAAFRSRPHLVDGQEALPRDARKAQNLVAIEDNNETQSS